jgi:hypothetical protein
LTPLDGVPAFVGNGRSDIVYANALAEALYFDNFRDPARPVNTARFLFLDPRARTFYVDWEQTAHDVAASLHREVGRNPYDRALSDLIGILSTRSEEFRQEWARHDVRQHRSGTKRLRHPLVGDLTLEYEVLELPADPGLTLVTYSSAPGSVSEDRLAELGRWANTRDRLTSAPQLSESSSGGSSAAEQGTFKPFGVNAVAPSVGTRAIQARFIVWLRGACLPAAFSVRAGDLAIGLDYTRLRGQPQRRPHLRRGR